MVAQNTSVLNNIMKWRVKTDMDNKCNKCEVEDQYIAQCICSEDGRPKLCDCCCACRSLDCNKIETFNKRNFL